jgi:hypothetical protein
MTDPELLVQDYLARLERAAAGLDPDRRADLLAGISEHLDAARSTGEARDEAGVRTLLDRLGAPADIVAAADDDQPVGPQGQPPRRGRPRRGTGLELAAVLMLTAGSFLPVIGWLVGVVLLWCSDRWRAGEKLLGTLVVPLGPGGVLIIGGFMPFQTAQSCSGTVTTVPSPQPLVGATAEVVTCTTSGSPQWVAQLLVLTLLVAAVAIPVWLYRTARRRADAEPAQVPALR